MGRFAVVDPNNARELLLLVLLVKILAAASIASILGRSASFKRLLFRPEKTVRQQFIFGFVLGAALFVGAALRVILKFQAPDLGLEGAVLAGVLYGNIAGMIAGGLASLPALAHQEILALPLLLIAGALGGFARSLAPSKDIVWHFSPFFDLNLYRWFRQRFGYPRGGWQMFFFMWLIVLEASRILLGRAFPGKLYYLFNGSSLILIAICLTTIACVAIPLTIWKNIRIELQLEEQGRLLMQARLDALTAQINPHFLFNTLNSIASLVRIDPETARQVIVKLSSILRRLLQKHENFTPLNEELAFIDDYLSIEVIRFGEQKLRIVKEIEDQTLPLMVPSMLLQPIVENAIRHGLSPKVEGGVIAIRSCRENGRLILEVRDNGVGIPLEQIEHIYQQGIGINNVRERLRVLYGSEFIFQVDRLPEGGTSIQIGIPLLAN
ncbi:MAG: histidine kinase [Acidobacteria bacterium]|nr:histidine kinase [Acidobacteriota bacterium]